MVGRATAMPSVLASAFAAKPNAFRPADCYAEHETGSNYSGVTTCSDQERTWNRAGAIYAVPARMAPRPCRQAHKHATARSSGCRAAFERPLALIGKYGGDVKTTEAAPALLPLPSQGEGWGEGG